jgi:hypothetical protein
MPFTITSVAFRSGEVIPSKYTRDGETFLPLLNWRNPPQHTGLGESEGRANEGAPPDHCRGRVGGVYVWQG